MAKAFSVKSKASKSTTRWSVPDHLAKPMTDLAAALGCKGIDIVEQLVRHQPNTELTLVGKGGFVISLNIPIYSLTEDDLDKIMQARLGDDEAAESARDVEEAEDNVSIAEGEKAEAAVEQNKPASKMGFSKRFQDRTEGASKHQESEQSEEENLDFFTDGENEEKAGNA